ncbi:M23 family metallopeptidase [Mucilaginibacter gotjawali]|uniref:Murein DD-endopeptidase MepM/ murein hydrolase activator NlpD n=2 Tax=Mucilaginibacter gotjawali TaxID=1550579 RepID=A0A839SNC7_9SPHI|nr:M23 family metallopeptidase [Mucilaginibacter gotjawali]MBB3057999.1 murein DD-endopeptidase MepM/ murein hydrolase activator NlpD [Mucilaginibacter gotjawali]BAU51975.1 Murein DD-endopeptidase MepM [Mucilaginibacter gotjawali]
MKTLISFCLVCLPLKHLKINSDYGYRIHPLTGRYAMHAGVDLKASHDTVYAILDGVVKSTGYDDGLGLNIWLQHGPVESIYGHLSRILITINDSVKAGEPIAISGSTGRSTGEHLHFSICYRHKYLNPIQFLYELLIKQQNEQKFQSTSDTAFRKADRRN